MDETDDSGMKYLQERSSDEHYVCIVYVCSFPDCLRHYELVEDLRGHMIEYHGCQPITKKPPAENQSPAKVKLAGSTNGILEPLKDAEMRPVPFKDFRLLLRAQMTLRCSITYSCSYKFENAAKQILHGKCHIDATSHKFRCFECGVECINWRRCSAHMWKTHQLDVDLLHCPVCSYKANASVLVWRHMSVHKKWRSRVQRSMRAVQQRRQQALAKTAEGKQTPPAANKNKYYAEKTCEICNRKFVNGKTLSKHVQTVHNKIKPFICNVCGKKTTRKASLIVHMRQHTGEKPLQCKTCKFATRDPSVLNKHQMRHEKVGKLKCTQCDYTCIQTNAYKRHMRLNHHEEYKKIACDLCTYVTISVEKLEAHKEDHRQGLIVNLEDSLDAKNACELHEQKGAEDDCFLPLESVDSLPHEPTVDTGGVTIPAPSEDTQFPTYLNN